MFNYIVMILGYGFFIFATVVLSIAIKQQLKPLIKSWVLDKIIQYIYSYKEKTNANYSERNHRVADAAMAVSELKNLN